MLVFLRTFPILIGLTIALGAMALFWFPAALFWVIGISLLVLFFLLSRLVDWKFKKLDTWALIGIPFLLAVSSFSLLLFVEGQNMKIIIISLATFLVWLFAENLFTYLHLPKAYQVNALEYLAMVVNVLSVYFFTTALFAVRLFLSLPLWLVVPVFVVLIFVAIATTLWACKISKERLLPYALGGTGLATELFVVFTLLPSGFFPNATLLTLFFYLFLGIVRAQLLNKLNKAVIKRYFLAVVLITILTIWTSRWT